jgi:hypothetical protein
MAVRSIRRGSTQSTSFHRQTIAELPSGNRRSKTHRIKGISSATDTLNLSTGAGYDKRFKPGSGMAVCFPLE